ncbi:MAG: hypothetical protein EOR00_09635 [Mesorhizobium sp.]|uniref:hypothetical protein n=1 Tax=Mesorhizobium sp. TaxID=1871066 RepID=UPI000FE92F3E|nr:hypothetical protein [Mesorhizobium sp.]RWP18886.1 MAG: hypothetical protein EOR00_09635 [Mesorhizobium sp.]
MEQKFEAILVQLTRIADALENVGGSALGVGAAVPSNPTSPWDSAVPEGYDTVVGYFARTLPSAFDMMEDPIFGTQRDGFWCSNQARARDIQVVRVEAPEAMKQIGIETINAYPIELLEERIR